jgi:hypothetical protein
MKFVHSVWNYSRGLPGSATRDQLLRAALVRSAIRPYRRGWAASLLLIGRDLRSRRTPSLERNRRLRL